MSTAGLTTALRFAMANEGHWHPQLFMRAQRLGLIDEQGNKTPRGHAALAAPWMTQAELDTLENCEADLYVTIRMPSGHEWRTLGRLRDAGFVSPLGFALTPDGRTALNNVRAAMGSPDYKEGL